MAIRSPIAAGRFYEASTQDCLAYLQQMMPKQLPEPVTELVRAVRILGGVVPHAGWTFSGEVASKVFWTIQKCQKVDTFVIFGAIHIMHTPVALLYNEGQWETPLGHIDIDEDLGRQILHAAGDWMRVDCVGHNSEHSIEVEVPIIQHLFPSAKIVPIMTPPAAGAVQMGRAVAEVVETSKKEIVCIASTDLTHYGPSYGYTPMGAGGKAVQWAKDQNDRYFIDLILSLQADQLVETAQMYQNACGAGAVAATVAAVKDLGATEGVLLEHATSAEIMAEKFHQDSLDSVGYAAIILR